jgi:hypothetical protein
VWIQAQSGNTICRVLRSARACQIRRSSSASSSCCASSHLIPAARTAHWYFETTPCERVSARPISRADNSLDSNWMICLSWAIVILRFDIGGRFLQ